MEQFLAAGIGGFGSRGDAHPKKKAKRGQPAQPYSAWHEKAIKSIYFSIIMETVRTEDRKDDTARAAARVHGAAS
jgi:hypothetical protein